MFLLKPLKNYMFSVFLFGLEKNVETIVYLFLRKLKVLGVVCTYLF